MVAGLLTLVSASLFALGLPNEFFEYGQPIIALVSLSPFFVALGLVRSLRGSLAIGTLFAVVSTSLANYWLLNFQDYAVWTLGGAVLGYVLYHAVFVPTLWRLQHTHSTPIARVVVISAAWTGYEYLKSVGYLGYPWGLAGYPLNVQPALIQIVDLLGVWPLSFAVVATNMLIAVAVLPARPTFPDRLPLMRREWRPPPALRTLWRAAGALGPAILVVAGLWLGIIGYGLVMFGRVYPVRSLIDVVLVQPNTDSWIQGNLGNALLTAQRLSTVAVNSEPLRIDPYGRDNAAAATPAAAVGAGGPPAAAAGHGSGVDLVVWNETTLRLPYPHPAYETTPADQPFTTFLAALDVPLLSGSPLPAIRDPSGYENAALLLSSTGTILQRYGKTQLVPFAESVPFWDVPAVQHFLRTYVGLFSAGWTPGARYELFTVPLHAGGSVRFAAPICFEDAFAGVIQRLVYRGAEVLINLTNNSWSKTRSAQSQHMVAARFRAVENRIALVRSTNSGVTAVVDARGTIHCELPMFTEAAVRVLVPIYERRTTAYQLIGDAFAFGCLFLTLVAAARTARRRR